MVHDFNDARYDRRHANTDISYDLKENKDLQDIYLDRTINECDTSSYHEMPKIEKPSISQFKTEKQLLGCASAVFNPRRLSFKNKKRNPSVNSQEKMQSTKKMVPMST